MKDRHELTAATLLMDQCAAPVLPDTRATAGFASGTPAPEIRALRECPAMPSVRIHTSSVAHVLRYNFIHQTFQQKLGIFRNKTTGDKLIPNDD